MCQIQLPEPHDDILADGTLAGLVDTGVHMPERIGLWHDILLHGPIINRTQYPHIKRDGIADNAPAPEPVVILSHKPFIDERKGNVPSAQEIGETPECPPVVARRPQLSVRLEPCGLRFDIGEHGAPPGLAEPIDHIAERVSFPPEFKIPDDRMQQTQITVDPLLHGQQRMGFARKGRDDTPAPCIPLPGLETHGGSYLLRFAPMAKLVIYYSRFPADRRFPELDFYCCHTF